MRATASEEAERCWREVVNRQKEVEKELRSQLAVEERARVEADIMRRNKRDKKAARLKAKIRLMFESNGSEAESAGSEGSGSDEEGGGQKPGRERPAGLSYKLREATTRATVGADQQQGDVDAHGADREEAGIVEEADLVGQPADMPFSVSSTSRSSNSKWDGDMEKLV
eukprot:jgi/Tetstr1/458399/TSEL_044836.t1